MSSKITVAIDFDGVLHHFCSPFTRSTEVLDGPTEGALATVQSYLAAGFNVVIFSARACEQRNETNVEFEIGGGKEAIERWLKEHGFPQLAVYAEKPNAQLYIDDRGYQFDGTNWPTVEHIQDFLPWNRRKG